MAINGGNNETTHVAIVVLEFSLRLEGDLVGTRSSGGTVIIVEQAVFSAPSAGHSAAALSEVRGGDGGVAGGWYWRQR